jgi:hypothetical protein
MYPTDRSPSLPPPRHFIGDFTTQDLEERTHFRPWWSCHGRSVFYDRFNLAPIPALEPNAVLDGTVINGIRCDLNTAAYVCTHPGGDQEFSPEPESGRRFDEELWRTPEGYWFVIRSLAPDETAMWMASHGYEVHFRAMFPDVEVVETKLGD